MKAFADNSQIGNRIVYLKDEEIVFVSWKSENEKKQEGHDGPKVAHLSLLTKLIQFPHQGHTLKHFVRGPLDDATCHI